MSSDRVHRALKPDAQAFDEVRIVTVPRYKASGLSGDEWRISASVQFFRNGQKVHQEDGLRNVEAACTFLPYLHATAIDHGHAFFAGQDPFCDQEGCANHATITYRVKKHYCREGGAHEHGRNEVRRFCEAHSRRGDGALDDADRNYERIA